MYASIRKNCVSCEFLISLSMDRVSLIRVLQIAAVILSHLEWTINNIFNFSAITYTSFYSATLTFVRRVFSSTFIGHNYDLPAFFES